MLSFLHQACCPHRESNRKPFFKIFSSLYRYASILKTKAGFFGLVKNLVINDVSYGLVFPGPFTLAAVNVVMNSTKDMCMIKPCYHGGTCRVIENEVKCNCPRGFLGNRCEIRGARGYFIPCVNVQQIMTDTFTELTIFRMTSALAAHLVRTNQRLCGHY